MSAEALRSALEKHVAGAKVVDTICLAMPVISSSVTVLASDEPLIIPTISLP